MVLQSRLCGEDVEALKYRILVVCFRSGSPFRYRNGDLYVALHISISLALLVWEGLVVCLFAFLVMNLVYAASESWRVGNACISLSEMLQWELLQCQQLQI